MKLSIQKMTGPVLAKKIKLKDPATDRIMKNCLQYSQVVWESCIDGEGACIWGMISLTLFSTRAYIWLHTTEVADKHTFLIVRKSRLMLDEMLKEYSELCGHCKVEDWRAIRWLKWLGAVFGESDGVKISFCIRKK